mmetsp:Transcript_22870/g.40901  ORF Transcript_22870/g.40901 Transcript_22870/m.40901 type:complete len:220 (+) Transcript_22870:2-661(+)
MSQLSLVSATTRLRDLKQLLCRPTPKSNLEAPIWASRAVLPSVEDRYAWSLPALPSPNRSVVLLCLLEEASLVLVLGLLLRNAAAFETRVGQLLLIFCSGHFSFQLLLSLPASFDFLLHCLERLLCAVHGPLIWRSTPAKDPAPRLLPQRPQLTEEADVLRLVTLLSRRCRRSIRWATISLGRIWVRSLSYAVQNFFSSIHPFGVLRNDGTFSLRCIGH